MKSLPLLPLTFIQFEDEKKFKDKKKKKNQYQYQSISTINFSVPKAFPCTTNLLYPSLYRKYHLCSFSHLEIRSSKIDMHILSRKGPFHSLNLDRRSSVGGH